jgi:hypothetical protein
MFGKRSSYDSTPARRDNRKAARKAYKTAGWIRLEGGFAVRPCHVIDISDTGVRLSVEGDIPATFALLFSRNSKGRKARVKWRRGNLVGAEFL